MIPKFLLYLKPVFLLQYYIVRIYGTINPLINHHSYTFYNNSFNAFRTIAYITTLRTVSILQLLLSQSSVNSEERTWNHFADTSMLFFFFFFFFLLVRISTSEVLFSDIYPMVFILTSFFFLM